MSINLTKEQLQAAERSPVRVTDPETSQEYVVVRADMFNRITAMIDEDDARLMYPLLADIDPEDWEDISVYKQP